jgi:ABC-type glutathione transport system ATPase component
MTSLNPYLRISRQMTEVLVTHRGMGEAEARKAAIAMLDSVRIPEARRRFDMYPHEFSGGMRQRVMIAMALLCEPDLLVADEPTTALDVTIQAQILDLMRNLRGAGKTAIVMITHAMGVVAGLCDRVLVMYGGRIVEEATSSTTRNIPTRSDSCAPRRGSTTRSRGNCVPSPDSRPICSTCRRVAPSTSAAPGAWSAASPRNRPCATQATDGARPAI